MAGRAYKRLEWSYPDTGQDQGAVYETDPPGEGLMPVWPPSPVPANYVNTASIQDGAVTEPKLADQSVSNRTIVDFSVTSDKIGTEQVIGDKLAPLSVTEPKLADNSVSTRTYIDNSIPEEAYGDETVSTRALIEESVTLSKIQSSSIDSSVIANLGIATANYANASVTLAKLAGDVTPKLITSQLRPANIVLVPTAADFNNLLTLLTSAGVLHV